MAWWSIAERRARRREREGRGGSADGARGAPSATLGFEPGAARQATARRTVGVPPEVLRQVKLIELRTRGLVNSLYSGEYRSVFKGQGMEFSEVREYQPGDEVRSIDWNVTARMGRPFVKRYIEERELTVMLVVDVSGSERFGTVRRFKSEMASELGAVLAMAAVRNNDRVGLLLFTDRVEHVVPPRKGRRHALRVIRDLLVHEPQGTGTDIAAAVDYLGRMLGQHAIVFLVSDFQDAALERPLKLLARRHDLVAITVTDPGEQALPDLGLVRLRDPESGLVVDVDASDAGVREAFDRQVSDEGASRRHLLRRLAIDEIAVRTDTGYAEPLMKFFRARETRAAAGRGRH
ncbi:MAG TPA: DUF58 domain-containing protein [Gemmatimonadaceae bacterium]|nr:DUF58 domain-containing protein [Gemmatimonadaceae bacterium]